MAIEIKELNEGKVLEVRLTDKLNKMDYEKFVPAVSRLVQKQGPLNILMEMHDFQSWIQ